MHRLMTAAVLALGCALLSKAAFAQVPVSGHSEGTLTGVNTNIQVDVAIKAGMTINLTDLQTSFPHGRMNVAIMGGPTKDPNAATTKMLWWMKNPMGADTEYKTSWTTGPTFSAPEGGYLIIIFAPSDNAQGPWHLNWAGGLRPTR